MKQTVNSLRSLALCLLLLATASCQRGEVKTQATGADARQVPEDTLISLERRPDFFSSCPFYKLTISADGTVRIVPEDYSDERRQKVVSGPVITSRINQEQLKQLVSEFEKVDFFSLKNTFEDPSKNGPGDCPQHLFDSSSTIMSLVIKGRTKEVQHYLGCSGTQALSGLSALENKIDEAVQIKKWFDCEHGKNRINLSKPTGP